MRAILILSITESRSLEGDERESGGIVKRDNAALGKPRLHDLRPSVATVLGMDQEGVVVHRWIAMIAGRHTGTANGCATAHLTACDLRAAITDALDNISSTFALWSMDGLGQEPSSADADRVGHADPKPLFRREQE